MNNEPKIAKIIDSFNVVLNKGNFDKIEEGQEYLIYQQTEEIYDPETKELLECLFVPKGKGIITQVQEKISILHSNEYEKPSSLAEAFSVVLANPLKLKAFKSPQIGDSARLIIDTNEDKEMFENTNCLRCGNTLTEEESNNALNKGLCDYCSHQMDKINEDD